MKHYPCREDYAHSQLKKSSIISMMLNIQANGTAIARDTFRPQFTSAPSYQFKTSRENASAASHTTQTIHREKRREE